MSKATKLLQFERARGTSSPKFHLGTISESPQFRDPDWLREHWTPRYILMKRIIDIAIGVIVFFAFVLSFPGISIAIKLTSRGPIFYMQERVGQNGQVFRIIKYRSMVQDAERNGAQFAAANDSRVTRVGAIIRSTRLDELPQVINVLRGQMTVVGPRPERPHVIKEMVEIEPAFAMRTVVKPGLTGYAQVFAHYAATREQLLTKLEFDLYYIRHASLRMDIRVLMRTVGVVLHRQGT